MAEALASLAPLARQHRVRIEGSGEAFGCREDVNLLAAMEAARCTGIPVGCRNGGCGACRVRVTAGDYATRKMNRAVITEADEAAGCLLACRTYPRGDLTVQALGRAWRPARPAFSSSSLSGLATTTPTHKPSLET